MFDINTELKNREISSLQWSLICSKLSAINANEYPHFIFQAIDYAKARNLDIMSDHIYADVRTSGTLSALRIMTTIHGYRHIAHVSGEFAGIDAPAYGKQITIDCGGVKVNGYEYVEVTVYRKMPDGTKAGVTAREFLLENIVLNRDGKPNPIWGKRPIGQLTVRAEAQALRKAFSGCDAYTVEEYEFADSLEQQTKHTPAAKANKPIHGGIVEQIISMYQNAKTPTDINNASALASSEGGNIQAGEYAKIIEAFNNASNRIKALA